MPRLRRKWAIKLLAVLVVAIAGAGIALKSDALGRWLVVLLTPEWEVALDAPMQPTHATGPEAPQSIPIRLDEVATGFSQPTDMQFVPGNPDLAVVLEKAGRARLLTLSTAKHTTLFRVNVLTGSEEGLLGLAFHPDFPNNGRFFLNYVTDEQGDDVSRVAEWSAAKPRALDSSTFRETSVLMRVRQPYPNHDAGQLAFGPDGHLYVGWGDGGLRDDPDSNGQNPRTLLGSMLRIDVNRRSAGRPYGIPDDNPFVGRRDFAPETWAYGLRNPWRYSFDPSGRLVVADVGQDTWEEIDIVQPGDNLGWNVREGFSCLEKPGPCPGAFVDPVYVYGRDAGSSVTGGHVYQGTAVPQLRGKYVFGDFVSGRLFAIELPQDRARRVDRATSLGKWPLLPSAFGKGPDGELYVLGFGRGVVYRIAPAGG